MSNNAQHPVTVPPLEMDGELTGADIRNYRTMRGITQQELAAEWKCSARTIINWELRGDEKLPSRVLTRIRGVNSRLIKTPLPADKHRDRAIELLSFNADAVDPNTHPAAMIQCLQGIGFALLSLESTEVGR